MRCEFEVEGDFGWSNATGHAVIVAPPSPPPEPVCVREPLAALVAWWRGDMSFIEAHRMGLAIDGPKAVTRAFPKWFDLCPFAHIGPAVQTTAGGRQPRIRWIRGDTAPDCESGFTDVVTGMTWLILILVMAIAATRLVRHSLSLIAVAASIAVLVWLLMGRPSDPALDREAHNGGSRASATSTR